MNCVVVLSLLLCVATVALWVRSYVWVERFIDRSLDPGKRIDTIGSAKGALLYTHVRIEVSGERPTDRMAVGREIIRFHAAETGGVSGGTVLWGVPHGAFGWEQRVDVDPPRGPWRLRWTRLSIGVPHGALAALFAALPAAAALRRARGGGRRVRGECPTCGYDLRATPERCPECGAVPSQ